MAVTTAVTHCVTPSTPSRRPKPHIFTIALPKREARTCLIVVRVFLCGIRIAERRNKNVKGYRRCTPLGYVPAMASHLKSTSSEKTTSSLTGIHDVLSSPTTKKKIVPLEVDSDLHETYHHRSPWCNCHMTPCECLPRGGHGSFQGPLAAADSHGVDQGTFVAAGFLALM